MKTKDIKENINKEMECLISSDFSSVISKIENKKGVITNGCQNHTCSQRTG